MPRTISKLSACLVAVSVSFVVACGSSGASSSASGATSDASAGQLTTVKVGIIPVTTVAPLYLGIKEGIFAKAGLKIVPDPIATAPAAVANIVSGADQFAFAPAATIVQAQSKGIPVVAVDGGSYTAKTQDNTILVAGPKSGITSVAQLAGKKIAVNELQGQSELGIRAAAQAAGVKQSSLTFVALPFPDMATALANGDVAAAGIVPPFTQSVVAAGGKVLIPDYYRSLDPDVVVTSWITSDNYLNANRATTVAFSKALAQAFNYAFDHPAQLQAVIPEFTKTSLADAKKLPLMYQSPKVDMASLVKEIGLMKEFGLISKDVDPQNYVAAPVKSWIDE